MSCSFYVRFGRLDRLRTLWQNTFGHISAYLDDKSSLSLLSVRLNQTCGSILKMLKICNWYMHYHSWLVSHHCIETSTICVPSLYLRGTLKNDQQLACSFGSLGQPQFNNEQCNIAQQYRCREFWKEKAKMKGKNETDRWTLSALPDPYWSFF